MQQKKWRGFIRNRYALNTNSFAREHHFKNEFNSETREHYGYLCNWTMPRCELIVCEAKLRDENSVIEWAKETHLIRAPQFRDSWISLICCTNEYIDFIRDTAMQFTFCLTEKIVDSCEFARIASHWYWMCRFFTVGISIVSIGYQTDLECNSMLWISLKNDITWMRFAIPFSFFFFKCARQVLRNAIGPIELN